MRGRWVMLLAITLLATRMSSRAEPIPLSGYAKVFGSYAGSGDDDFNHAERLRLRGRYEPDGVWTLSADYELRAIERDQMDADEWDAGNARARFMDLEHESDGEMSVLSGLDRLWARYEPDPGLQLTVGRQAVSWGTGLIWSPVDLFAAFSPTEIDKEEKLGVDVARMLLSSPSGASLDVVVEPLDVEEYWTIDPDDSSAVARAGLHAGEYDMHGYAGVVQSDWILGADFAGYAGDAGLHGEAIQTWVDENQERDYLRAMVGVDYGFAVAWNPTVALEYFFNGLGEADPDDYVVRLEDASVIRVFARGIAYNIGREYVGGTVSMQPVALVRISATTLANLHDASFRQLAAIEWSVTENVDVIAGADIGYGETPGEFTVPADVFYVYGKYYF